MNPRNVAKVTLSTALALSLSIVGIGGAHADTDIIVHGALCNATPNSGSSPPSTMPVPGYSAAFGMHNQTTAEALLAVCAGAITNPNTTAVSATLTLFDRSQLDNFTNCTVTYLALNGDFMATKTFQVLNVNSPNRFTTNAVPHAGVFGARSFAVACSIPAATANGLSHLVQADIRTTP